MKRHLRPKKSSYYQRKVETREEGERILVVCEGEKTEPNYFRSFRVPGLVLVVEGAADNTVNVVQLAEERMATDAFDQVWCVFDRDSFPLQRFNAAIDMAVARGIKVAYSNEAFELWYLLHFDFLQAGVSRSKYSKMLTQRLNKRYEKNSKEMYSLLLSRQDAAIRNAKRLLSQFDPRSPGNDNPSTTVHLLVEELRRFGH